LKRIATLREEDEKDSLANFEGGHQELSQFPTRASVVIAPKPKEFKYAILPDGMTVHGWTHEDKLEIDDIVRHSLHSKRAKFKRSLKGFGKYVRRRKFYSKTGHATSANLSLKLLDCSLLYMLHLSHFLVLLGYFS